MPTTRKNIVISASLIQKCSDLEKTNSPSPIDSGRCQKCVVAVGEGRVGPNQRNGCCDQQHDTANGFNMQKALKRADGPIGQQLDSR